MTYDAYGVGSDQWSHRRARTPAEPTPAVGDPIAARPPAPAGTASVLTLPVLGDIVAPLVLAALCGAAMAFFSAGPRETVRAGAPRRQGRG